MTITLNPKVLIFTIVLAALGVGGYLVGTRMGDPPPATTVVQQPAPLTGGADPLALPSAVPDTAPRITMETFKAAFDANEDILIVDVRTPDQYAAGHIVGAVNIPEAETSTRRAELPMDRRIVLYCA